MPTIPFANLPDYLRTAPDGVLLAGTSAVVAALFVLTHGLQRLLCGPHDLPTALDFRLSVYETACLSGGRGRVLQAVLAKLVHEKNLAIHSVKDASDSALFVERPPAVVADRLERDIYSAVAAKPGGSVAELFPALFEPRFTELSLASLFPSFAAVSDRLVHELKLLLPKGRRDWAFGLPLLLRLSGVIGAFVLLNAANVIAPAGPRQTIGTVLFLALGVSLLASFICTSVYRTGRGDQVLAQLRADHAPLHALAECPPPFTGHDIAMAVGLFGLVALRNTPLADLLVALRSPPQEAFSET